MSFRAVFLDFYGTLARATHWVSADDVLAEHGYTLNDGHRSIYYAGGIDGEEHHQHSQSRDHYNAWRRERTLAMLAAADVHPDEHELIVAKLAAGDAERVMEAYAEVPAVLAELRARGLRIVICSNWAWDLREAVAESGLTDAVDAMVSSAWVGARKPHPHIFAATLEIADARAEDILFVGDTWNADVEGPVAAGFQTLYLQREGHWDDRTAPADLSTLPAGVTVATDLAGLLGRLGSSVG